MSRSRQAGSPTSPSARPVVSQRVIRAIDPTATAKGLKTRRILALAAPEGLQSWLKERNIAFTTSLTDKIDANVVVIGPCRNLSAQDKARLPVILDFVRAGGRLVILAQDDWDCKALADFELVKGRSSRVFLYPNAKHPLLAGIDPEYLKRWNGLPGEIANRAISGPLLDHATRLLWMEKPSKPIAVSVLEGQGEIVICLLGFRDRLGRAAKHRDPAAERIASNLLQR